MDASNEDEQDPGAPKPSPARDWRRQLRLLLMRLGPAIVVAVAAYFYLTGGRFEATDDAYVQKARVDVSANVAGRVKELAVRDNQDVRKGDVLFRLDDAPFPFCPNTRTMKSRRFAVVEVQHSIKPPATANRRGQWGAQCTR